MRVKSTPPSIVKVELYAINEGYLSDLCGFMTFMMSMTPMSRVESDMNVDIEIAFKGGPSDGAHPNIILFMDSILRHCFMLKKDFHPKSLRSYLLLQQFDFEVRDKG